MSPLELELSSGCQDDVRTFYGDLLHKTRSTIRLLWLIRVVGFC